MHPPRSGRRQRIPTIGKDHPVPRHLQFLARIALLGLPAAALAQSAPTSAPPNDAPPNDASPANAPPADAPPAAAAHVDAPVPPPPDKSGYLVFANPTPDSLLRSFSTDRPAKSNSPLTVDAGHVQYESDLFNYLHSNAGGVTTRLYTAFDPVLKLGITNRVDFEVQFTGYDWVSAHDPATGLRLSTNNGAGDITLRTKVNLFGNEGGAAAALIPYVKFPTASRGIGNGRSEGGIILPISVPGPWGFTIEVEPEVDVLKNAVNAGHHFNYTQLLNISHAITSKLTVEAEFFSAIGTDKGTPAVYTFDAALAYLLTPTLQLDIGTNIGLNHAAPNLQLYTGIAQRF